MSVAGSYVHLIISLYDQRVHGSNHDTIWHALEDPAAQYQVGLTPDFAVERIWHTFNSKTAHDCRAALEEKDKIR